MPGFRSLDGIEAVEPLVPAYVARYPVKFWWFLNNGYRPHTWQILFHGAHHDNGHLVRMRHLSAGRRGGKTLSAAWEVAFYALHPSEYHRDAHGEDSNDPLWIWVLSKSYKTVRVAILTFLGVLRKLGLQKGRDYEYNKTERVIEFPDGTLVEFKTADDPDNLRGPGLHILWIEEAAMLADDEAWNVVRPALSDKLGLVLTTTTPKGKNWYWEEFWHKLERDPNQFRVEYTTIDNTAVPGLKDEWEYAKQTYHPLLFKQEYMASFDAMAGVALSGEWLHYFVLGRDSTLTHDDDIRLIPENGKLGLRTFLAVDPATGEGDDSFAMALIGLEQDNSQAYVLDTYVGKIPFPDQVALIQEWFHKYRPEMIGVEAVAYQRVLVQQLMRLPGLPNIIPVFTKGSKPERILAMSPVFKTGRVRIHRRHRDFIDQWVSYDPPPPFGTGSKKQKDDLLDAVEIGLSLAGFILPRELELSTATDLDGIDAGRSLEDLARTDFERLGQSQYHDPELGAEFG